MPNERKDIDAALRKLATEVRRGVSKMTPLTPEQKQAIEKALTEERLPIPREPERERTPRIERDHDRGHDIEID